MTEEKNLTVTSVEDAAEKKLDFEITGNGNTFALICKASSPTQGWMKSAKAMQVPGGCVVQVTTQQKNPDKSYALAEALTFVHGVILIDDPDHEGGRKLVAAD